MARAARYGNIQPSEFLKLDWDDALDLADRVQRLHADDEKFRNDVMLEHTKAIVQASGARVAGDLF